MSTTAEKTIFAHFLLSIFQRMTERTIIQNYAQIVRFIDERQLAEAFVLLDNLLAELGDWTLCDEFEQQKNTYKDMLQYAVLGVPDSQRKQIYDALVESLYALASMAKSKLLTRFSQRLPYAKKRLEMPMTQWENLQTDLSVEDKIISEKSAIQLFDYIWIKDEFDNFTLSRILQLLESKNVKLNAKCLAISAVTLSALRFYDAEKLSLLLRCANSEKIEIRQRVLVGLILVFAYHSDRILLDKNLMAQIVLLSDSSDFRKELKSAFLQLVRTTETESVTRRIRTEIMPEMMRLSPLIQNKLEAEALRDEDDDEKNPDWNEIFDEAGITDKLQEFNDLQMDGADVYVSTFAKLKTFSFFSETANWLLPFDAQHSSISSVMNGDMSIFAKLLAVPHLCNSDKYSFCLSLLQVPENQRKMMLNGVEAESEQIKEFLNEKALLYPEITAQSVANQYVQDLYRLYTLHPRRADFENPLSAVVAFYRSPLFAQLFQDVEMQQQIAEFYFAKNLYAESAEQFENLREKLPTDGALLQKMGYCYQKLSHFEKAIETYKLANDFLPENFWTWRHLAFCCRRAARFSEALNAYQKCDLLKPDNFKIVMQIGHCLVALNRYKEAIETYFRADNLQPDSPTCLRAVAWCYLLDNQKEKSVRQYEKLLENSSSADDLLNAAHALFLSGKRARALTLYRRSLATFAKREDFFSALLGDKPTLLALGVSEEEFLFLFDCLKLS